MQAHSSVLTLQNDDFCRALRQWVQVLDDFNQSKKAGEQTLQTELEEKRKQLRTIAAIPEFRKGLLLSSPVFERSLEAYSASSPHQLDRKLRRTERTLLSYLLRTCYKTSPFGTLTPVCFARLTEDAEDTGMLELHHAEFQSFVRPNFGILDRISTAITRLGIQAPSLRVGIKDGWMEEHDKIKYRRRTVRPVIQMGVMHSFVSEYMFALPKTLSLQVVLKLFESSPHLSVHSIQQELVGTAHMTEPDAGEFISLLLNVDFLVVDGLQYSWFDPGLWQSYSDSLVKSEVPAMQAAGKSLQKIGIRAQRYAAADLSERRMILRDTKEDTENALASLGSQDPIPQPLLYEDSTLKTAPLRINQKRWQRHLEDLAGVQRLLPIFDSLLVSKFVMKALFKKHYGQGGICTDLVSFADTFTEVWYKPFCKTIEDSALSQTAGAPPSIPNPFKLPEIARIERVLRDLRSASSNSVNCYDLAIPSELPSFEGLGSHSFYCQAAEIEGERVLVLNQVYSGLASMFSRFTHMFAEGSTGSLADALRSTLNGLQPPGTLFAEIQGGQRNNANLHPLLTPAEIILVGERPTPGSEEQITLSDLVIKHDPQTNSLALFCKRLKKEIVPLYLGSLLPQMLPELHQVLLHFSCVSFIRPKFWPVPALPPQLNTPLFQPRVRYRSIVIERAKWIVSRDQVPRREKAEPDFDYLVRMAEWRQSIGLPSQMYITLLPGSPSRGVTRDKGDHSQGVLANKPLYIDFDNMLCVLLLEKVVDDFSGNVVFTEALPSREQLWMRCNGAPHVAEFVFEITQDQSLCQ
jgi:hypothetical protein